MKTTLSRANKDETDKLRQGTCAARRGFTLIELLVAAPA